MLYLAFAILAVSACKGSQVDNDLTGKIHAKNLVAAKSVQETELSENVFRKVYSYTKNTNAFKHVSYERIKAGVINTTSWDPPTELKENIPYYHAGYDYQNRPVWIAEIGKIDFRRIVEKGEKSIAEAKRYLFQAVINGIKSLAAVDSEGEEVRDVLIIFDMDSASIRQLNYLPSWVQFAELFGMYWDLVFQLMGHLVVINANYVTKLAADIARPVVGQLMERVEVYGNSRNTWLPKLLKLMPIEVIPPWYGGKPNFKPVNVYG